MRNSDGNRRTPQLPQLAAGMLDRAACLAAIIAAVHPQGPACPHCSRRDLSPTQVATWRAGGKVRCGACGRSYTWATGTPLSGMKITPEQLIIISTFVALGLNPAAIADLADVSTETVRRWTKRLSK